MTSPVLNIDDSFITQQEDSNGKRYYEVNTKRFGKQKYPSVSTLVNFFADKSGLDSWKKSLGYKSLSENETNSLSPKQIDEIAFERGIVLANEVMQKAAKRGTKTHGDCEAYFEQGIISDDACFQRLLPFLKICQHLAVEKKVKWEWPQPDGTVIGWAGRFDNVSLVDLSLLKNEYNEPLGSSFVPAILDYKTWDKAKYNKGCKQDNTNYYPLLTYYLQLTAYLAGFNQCKYYPNTLIQDCFLVGVTETCKEPWIYHLNIHKINYLFTELRKMVLAYNNLAIYSWQELEKNIEPFLGERVYLTSPKLKF